MESSDGTNCNSELEQLTAMLILPDSVPLKIFHELRGANDSVPTLQLISKNQLEVSRGSWLNLRPLGFSSLNSLEVLLEVNNELPIEVDSASILIDCEFSGIAGINEMRFGVQPSNWNRSVNPPLGEVLSSSAEFLVPNGFRRADVSWVSAATWQVRM